MCDISPGLFVCVIYHVTLIPSLLHLSILKRCQILSNAFPALIEMIMGSSLLILLMWYIQLMNICMMNPFCIQGVNPLGNSV